MTEAIVTGGGVTTARVRIASDADERAITWGMTLLEEVCWDRCVLVSNKSMLAGWDRSVVLYGSFMIKSWQRGVFALVVRLDVEDIDMRMFACS